MYMEPENKENTEELKRDLDSGWELDKDKEGNTVYTHDAWEKEKEFEYDIDL